ncbi:HAD hydrolase-like protein [Devosia oryziradicis]|uniref:HAD hydrolase-like protein n=1 Tax=Devosia oryziradicis TaxID=2801335 RepID=A0ABX7BU20_9HYPH|nr:HAD family hydrolase [Devosia oryziradicis]QQR35418.1 HAD hydrolase-like protein [Devosia oryziradicis]
MSPTVHQLTIGDFALARQLAPVIRFADNEPFLPSHVGISILDAPGRSPSSRLDIAFETGVAKVIEYAVWWDWDIQHLYELEHIWLKLDAADKLVAVEASSHGGKLAMTVAGSGLPLDGGRVTLVSTPGKHAFTASAEDQTANWRLTSVSCQELAGLDGVLINDRFRPALAEVTAEDHRAVKRYLQARAFLPSATFEQRFDLADSEMLSWDELAEWIPGRVKAVLAQVRYEQPLLKAVFLDSGDTLVNEATEKLDAEGYVTEARLIPGALEMVRMLASEGYRIVLVADGQVRSFDTVLGDHGITPHFHARVISETAGCEKPDRRMFDQAMAAAGLSADDAGLIVMVGNHLERDIGGANQLGIVSIWQNWSKKRSHIPENAQQVPDYTIRSPGELPQLLADIERQMARAKLNPAGA